MHLKIKTPMPVRVKRDNIESVDSEHCITTNANICNCNQR